MRALILVRLSKVTDATTSPQRQRKDCEDYCQRQGMTVAGVAEDLDVSGSTDPLERTGSGPWLRDRLAEFDVVVAAKLDRFGRSTRHVYGLFDYLRQHGKALRTADDQINTAGPAGELIIFILSWAAQMELTAISERNANAAQHLITTGAYRGGLAPAGYRAEKVDRGRPAEDAGLSLDKGWRLVPDEVLAPVLREVVARVLEGERLATICRELNDQGVPTQRDRQAALQGRPTEGRRWTVSNLRRVLESPTLLGQVVHRPVIGTGDSKTYGPEQVLFVDGAPQVRAEPLISDADYRRVKAILAERAEESGQSGARRKVTASMLVRVLFCGVCGKPMYRLPGGKGRRPRYRCQSATTGQSCGNASVLMETVELSVHKTVLGILGAFPNVERRWNPGSAHDAEILELDAQLESLAEAIPRFPAGSAALASVLAQVDSLGARRDALEAEPGEAAGWTLVETGGTFAERWSAMSDTERNDYLRNYNVRVDWSSTGGTHVHINELFNMFEEFFPGHGETAGAAVMDYFRSFPSAETIPDGDPRRNGQ